MGAKLDASEMPYWPAAMTQQMAAAYCGLSVDTFVEACPVVPIVITKAKTGKRYLRIRLDEWLMSLDQNGEPEAVGDGCDPRRSPRQARCRPPGVRGVTTDLLSLPSDVDPGAWAEMIELSKIPGQVIYYRGSLMDRETFRQTILSKPMGKLERQALQGLYSRSGEDVPWGEIKGGGGTTQKTLEVRGYVAVTEDGDRSVSWRITDSGIAWVEADPERRNT